MGDIDGIGLVVRQDPRTCRMPVIMILADVLPASVTRALAAGANTYIHKPLDFDELLRTVERVLHLDDGSLGVDPGAPGATATEG